MTNIVIVTGAGSGIGRALAINLSLKDIPVLAVGRRLNKLEETAKLGHSKKITPFSCDIATIAGREKLIHHLADQSLSGLVHCAGTFPIQSLDDISLDSWRETFATNLEARLFLSRDLKSNLGKDGRILFIGSMSATTARKGAMAYCASKAASFMLQECLKKEFNNQDPAVGIAIPGPVKTPILDQGMEADLSIFPDGAGYANSPQIDPERLGRFLSWLLIETDRISYESKQWDIRHEDHHNQWLGEDELFITV
ncbi:SDR family oxidoreductase [Curvivirga sp.]|uniref:SDR family oxidoreductase n=1 Tax=Curvivirga sp. TaxID=2856848 RepID=UPI003B5A88D1